MAVVLSNWFNPHVTSLHGGRGGSPAGTLPLVIDDCLTPDRLRALRQMLGPDAPWQDRYSVFGRGRSSYADWQAAAEPQRFYHYRVLHEPAQDPASAAEWPLFLMFLKVLGSADFREFLAGAVNVTPGPSLESEIHLMTPDHFLRRHTDAVGRRNLCGTLYFGEEWQPGFGGEFVVEHDGQHLELAPLPNRLILFDPRCLGAHYVAPIAAPEGWRRLSVSLWWSQHADSTSAL